MSFIARPPDRLRSAERPPEEIDALLRRFFHAELPVRLPRLTLTREPEQGIGPRPPRGLRWSNRIAAAAAVLLLVAGFELLSSRFPAEAPKDQGPALSGPEIGSSRVHRLGGPRRQTTPRGQTLEKTRNGGEALLQWEQLPGGLFMRIEERRPPQR